jgi:hypothetical protein
MHVVLRDGVENIARSLRCSNREMLSSGWACSFGGSKNLHFFILHGQEKHSLGSRECFVWCLGVPSCVIKGGVKAAVVTKKSGRAELFDFWRNPHFFYGTVLAHGLSVPSKLYMLKHLRTDLFLTKKEVECELSR